MNRKRPTVRFCLVCDINLTPFCARNPECTKVHKDLRAQKGANDAVQ